jgi:hypothetical protein
MHREGPQLRKACAFDELAFLFAPLRNFAPRVRPAVEQVEARRVADALVVEVSNPRVHLRRFHVIATETRKVWTPSGVPCAAITRSEQTRVRDCKHCPPDGGLDYETYDAFIKIIVPHKLASKSQYPTWSSEASLA